MPALCALCSAQESRYKCPICLIPYCSLSCYKPHKELHPPTETNTNPDNDPLAALLTSLTSPPPPQSKFSPLRTNLHLLSLLRQNPSLSRTLYSIYACTLPPPEDHHNQKSDAQEEERAKLPYFQKLSKRKEMEWTQEIGDRKGLKRLARLRNVNGVIVGDVGRCAAISDGPGADRGTLEEFIEIVLEAVGYGKEGG